jgi:zinc protease
MSFRSQAPKTKAFKPFSIPSFLLNQSHQGTPYFHHETKDIGVVKIEILFPFGRHHQNQAFQALAATELLLSGSDGKSERVIFSEIEHLGASVSNECHSLYSSVQIRCSKLVVLEVFKWVTHHLLKSDYPNIELDRYITLQVASLQRKMQTASYWSDKVAKQHYYENIPWENAMMTTEDLEALDRHALLEFHKKHFKTASAALFFSGDINKTTVHSILNTWDTNSTPPFHWSVPVENLDYAKKFTTTIEHPIKNSSQLSLKWLKHIGEVDERKQHQLTLLNMVFGGYFGSRLMQELREKQGLTYGISSFFRPLWKGWSWEVSGEMNSENKDKALDGIKQIIQTLQTERVSKNELNRAKTCYLGAFRSGFDGPFAYANKSITSLVREYQSSFYQNTLEQILDIQPDELITLAQKEMDTNSFIKVIAGKLVD